jgi:hypothetical protein
MVTSSKMSSMSFSREKAPSSEIASKDYKAFKISKLSMTLKEVRFIATKLNPLKIISTQSLGPRKSKTLLYKVVQRLHMTPTFPSKL